MNLCFVPLEIALTNESPNVLCGTDGLINAAVRVTVSVEDHTSPPDLLVAKTKTMFANDTREQYARLIFTFDDFSLRELDTVTSCATNVSWTDFRFLNNWIPYPAGTSKYPLLVNPNHSTDVMWLSRLGDSEGSRANSMKPQRA